jgi:hypothetical protein
VQVHVVLFGQKRMQLRAYPGETTFELSLLGGCMSAIHLGSNVEVPNSQINIWIASTLVECLPKCLGVLNRIFFTGKGFDHTHLPIF